MRPTCLSFLWVVFCYCILFMISSIVFEGVPLVIYSFWYVSTGVLIQAAADLVMIMCLFVLHPKWHITWIFVYQMRHVFWGTLVYLFRVGSCVYVTFINASIVFDWIHHMISFWNAPQPEVKTITWQVLIGMGLKKHWRKERIDI